jgi:tripartite-type tricarboxylate transporter receptor subunit TctC
MYWTADEPAAYAFDEALYHQNSHVQRPLRRCRRQSVIQFPRLPSNARLLLCALLGATLLVGLPASAADQYPAHEVRIVAPFTAGGATDILARLIAQRLSDALKVPFVVENKPGANGAIGADFVAKAVPDGYTLLMGSNGPNAINGVLYPKLSYDPQRDFAPIAIVALVPNVLLVSPQTPAGNVRELLELARSKPGQLSFGSAGVGSPAHLAAELFKSMGHVDMVHVPYKGGAATLPDLIAGRIDVMFADQLFAVPQVKSGKVRALAVTTAHRSRALPDLPTVAESGLPGYDTGLWYALFAPRGTPDAIVHRLNVSLVDALKTPEMREQIAKQGGEVVGSSPEELAALVKSEMTKWGKVVNEFGIRAEQ